MSTGDNQNPRVHSGSIKIIAKTLGGSRAYGLATASSDFDERFVFLNTSLNQIIGLDKYKHEHDESLTDGQDLKGKEIRRFFNLLRKSNTEAIEILFSSDFVEKPDALFLEMQKEREKLLDSKQMRNCLAGYSAGERRLMNGVINKNLGAKRKENLELYSYSPKNAVQLIRLNWAGQIFFNKGYFPVSVSKEDSVFAAELLDIKLNPIKYSKEEINSRADEAEKAMNKAFENRNFDFKFDIDCANDYILRFYYPMLEEEQVRIQNKK